MNICLLGLLMEATETFFKVCVFVKNPLAWLLLPSCVDKKAMGWWCKLEQAG